MRDRSPVYSVAERDIDLLLLEEFTCSPEFRAWFLGQLDLPDLTEPSLLGAWHSVTHPTLGESDLEVGLRHHDDSTHLILIENKVTAPPQPDQADRYRLRGEGALRQEGWDDYTTCIVAPRRYLDSLSRGESYEGTVTYEDIKTWLEEEAGSDPRIEFKLLVLDAAIEQNRRGYDHTPDADVTRFWRDYWRIASEKAPDLEMVDPGQRAAGSDWIQFIPGSLPSDVKLLHKLEHGNVDLQFSRLADQADEVEARINDDLPADVQVDKAGGSLVLRIEVPPIDRFVECSQQEERVEAGLEAAETLVAWHEEHGHRIPL